MKTPEQIAELLREWCNRYEHHRLAEKKKAVSNKKSLAKIKKYVPVDMPEQDAQMAF